MVEAVAASKRVAALTGYMLAVFLVAGSVGLYRLDAQSYRDDAQAILALQRLDRYLSAHDPTADQMPMRRAAARSLERSDPDLLAAPLTKWWIVAAAVAAGLGSLATAYA